MVRENDLSSVLSEIVLLAAFLIGAGIQCLYKTSSQCSTKVFCKPSPALKKFNCTHQDDDALAYWEPQQEEWRISVGVLSLSIAF